MDIKKDILWRVHLSFIIIMVIALFVLGRVFYIQNFQGKYWKSKGDSLHLTYFPTNAERGTIYSEDGNILSTSVPEYDVYIDFRPDGLREENGKRFFGKIDSLTIYLSQLFCDSTNHNIQVFKDSLKNAMVSAYNKKDPRFLLKRKVNYEQYITMRTFPLIKDGKNKSGFLFEVRDKRINPYGLLANRTIGLSRLDSKMNVGLERTYDSFLRGTSGQRLMRYAEGSYIPVEGAEVDPIDGKDIVTTIDTYIQDVAEMELMNMLVSNNSEHGTVIVMETATGKIKAIANLGLENGEYIEKLNYGFGTATEPGSVFKLVTLLSLLEDKYVTIDSKVDCEGGAKNFYGLTIKDSHHGTGTVSVKEAFAISSNVAFAKLANQFYATQPTKFWEHIDRFRLNKMTGIDIVATSGRPTIKNPNDKSWSKTTIPYMAHGYEELVTPLHLLMLYNAVANNGKMMKPYLVSAIKENGMDIKTFSPVVLVDKICSDETLRQARECLRAVVESKEGTAHKRLFDSTYQISGKTGTAVSAQNNQGYQKNSKIYQSSFMGFFPSNQPKYTIAVVIQNTRESKLVYGADVAGSVFKKVSDKIYNKYLKNSTIVQKNIVDSSRNSYYGKVKDLATIFREMNVKYNFTGNQSEWGSGIIAQKNASVQSVSFVSNIVPNVKGMGLKDAIEVLESKGLSVLVSGKGRVVSQSINEGSQFIKGQKIILMLN